MHNVRTEVDQLLDMYTRYKTLQAEVDQLGRIVARQKAAGATPDTSEYERKKQELQDLSDAMTFASPTIWMMYKHEAYQNEAQPITTMHDFRMHCSKPSYICTKRFEFVNESLEKRNLPTLADANAFPDTQKLSEVYEAVAPLEADAEFMADWRNYEYHKTDRVAKWENYAKAMNSPADN